MHIRSTLSGCFGVFLPPSGQKTTNAALNLDNILHMFTYMYIYFTYTKKNKPFNKNNYRNPHLIINWDT